jgi:hypothetical protein
MEAACPVDGDVRSAGCYAFCCGWKERWMYEWGLDKRAKKMDRHIEPPAAMEQNSKTPSNAGLSGPGTRTVEESVSTSGSDSRERTAVVAKGHLVCGLGRHAPQKVNVLVGVEGGHVDGGCPFRSLRRHCSSAIPVPTTAPSRHAPGCPSWAASHTPKPGHG